MKFGKNVAEGDSTYAKELFTSDAVCSGCQTGCLSMDQSSNSTAMSTIDNFKARIGVLAVEETVAAARVLEEGWSGRIDFTVFLLLKLDGEWKCV